MFDAPTADMLEKICEAFYNRNTSPRDPDVRFHSVHEFDVLNYRFEGSIFHDGHTYGFVIQDGNWNGTEVLDWSDDPENVAMGKIEQREPMTFVPADPNISAHKPHMFAVYCLWRREQWFKDKVKALNYDAHFSPGELTRKRYQADASKKGLAIGHLCGMSGVERALIEKSDAGEIEYADIVRTLKSANDTDGEVSSAETAEMLPEYDFDSAGVVQGVTYQRLQEFRTKRTVS